jgi:hypothetical protein
VSPIEGDDGTRLDREDIAIAINHPDVRMVKVGRGGLTPFKLSDECSPFVSQKMRLMRRLGWKLSPIGS